MVSSRRGLCLLLALAGAGAARTAVAQQAPAPYYGYQVAQAVPPPPPAPPSAQAPQPSGQVNYTCQPGTIPTPDCQPDRSLGCHVDVCPCPCSGNGACDYIKGQIPAIHPVPSCQEACIIYDELPPTTTPRDVTIYRNCYVPIRIQPYKPTTPVTTVNLHVKWREIHVLCGPDGKPLSTEQSAAALQQLNAQAAGTAIAAAPPAPMMPEPTAAAPAASPEKRWVWLASQGVYGFGYQRPDGYWVIDQGSKRPTLPDGATAANVTPAPAAPTATTAAPAAPVAAPAAPAVAPVTTTTAAPATTTAAN